MKHAFEIKQLILAGVLIVTGMLAPSNGIDSLIKESTRTVVAYAFGFGVAIGSIYLVYQKLMQTLERKETNNETIKTS